MEHRQPPSRQRALAAYAAYIVLSSPVLYLDVLSAIDAAVPTSSIWVCEFLIFFLAFIPVTAVRRPFPLLRVSLLLAVTATFALWVEPLMDALSPIADLFPSSGFMDLRGILTVTTAALSLISAVMLGILSSSWRVAASVLAAGAIVYLTFWLDLGHQFLLIVWYLWLGTTLWLWMASYRTFGPGQCLNCGYSRAGLASPRCPECGAEFAGSAPAPAVATPASVS